jgi:hypothetical protein
MTANAIDYVIIYSGYGSYNAYTATKDNAMMILENHIQDLNSEVLAMVNDKSKHYVSNALVAKLMLEVLSVEVGQNLPEYQKFLHGYAPREAKDNRPEVLNKPSYLQELALFMVENNISKNSLSKNYGIDFEKIDPIANLSLFKDLVKKVEKPIKYVEYEDYFSMAERYENIINNRWKKDAPEHKIVSSILQFVNEYLVDSNDIKYEVTTLSPVFE